MSQFEIIFPNTDLPFCVDAEKFRIHENGTAILYDKDGNTVAAVREYLSIQKVGR